MDDQNKNLILATALSFLVILIWFALFPPPETEPITQTPDAVETSPTATSDATIPTTAAPAQTTPAQTTLEASSQDAPRVAIQSPRLVGSISLAGGRIDDLSLLDYKTSLDPDASIVKMLSPAGAPGAYYALYGWAPGAGVSADLVPGPSTLWSVAEGAELTPQTPITLEWSNGAGLTFTRRISLDETYMFSITQSVRNDGDAAVDLAAYGILARHGLPEGRTNIWIVHEGAIWFAQDEFGWESWDDLVPVAERAEAAIQSADWTGFTDHYWQSVLIANKDSLFDVETFQDLSRGIYQTSATYPTQTVSPGQTLEITSQFFSGAKEWEALKSYQDAGVTKFLKSIDWGWFEILTRPIFWMLHELNKLIGNMGWAIIGLTLIVKAILFPLAYKSYVSMAKMKELQPEMEKIKERAGEDRQKLQKEMMELYKKEKVNPAAGCLPILLQIPIFFSLYKVIFVTIELRHAAWLGPFQDLSAPDPTSILNLFGLLPFAAPDPTSIVGLIFIGILPLILGISMWLQQKLNPAPTDPTQQMIFAWMPWVFMFMLGTFASGLIVYWIANNVITFTQQYIIMRSQGYKPDVFGNIASGFKRKSRDKT